LSFGRGRHIGHIGHIAHDQLDENRHDVIAEGDMERN
jgi:hypothetical protein